KRVFLVILFTSFSGSLVSRIPGAVQYAVSPPLSHYLATATSKVTLFAGADIFSMGDNPAHYAV
ncbi:hypothetical protein P4I29_24590, partial [Escherichia coli]|uniref:hypothetical protein n=1 Tax=Escherichia coli TaxID=562 RepID=UPI003CF36344